MEFDSDSKRDRLYNILDKMTYSGYVGSGDTEFVDVFSHYKDEKTTEQEAVPALQRHSKAHPHEAEYIQLLT